MGELRNHRHEIFARELARGKNVSECYVIAGYQDCRQNAHRLASNDDIQRRVSELKERHETETKNDRDPVTGQFLMGHKSNGGRPRGSRNVLGEKFIADLCSEWEISGADVLKRVVQMDPVAFMKTIAQILPHKVDAAIEVHSDLFAECRDFIEAYRLAKTYIGAEPLIEVAAERIEDANT